MYRFCTLKIIICFQKTNQENIQIVGLWSAAHALISYCGQILFSDIPVLIPVHRSKDILMCYDVI